MEARSAVSDAPAQTNAAIAVDGLVRRFGEREALTAVDVTLEHGQTLVVFGPNGAGKTTLLRVLATLLVPHAGSVHVLGRELPREAHVVRERVGLLAHEPLLYRELSGRENLDFYASLYRLNDSRDRVEALLEASGMSERGDDPVRELSRGMVQRLAVCRAVLHRPELLLLDEPLAGLDPEAVALVEPLIGHASGATRVVTSHDIERGLAEADRVLGLRSGEVVIDVAAAAVTAEQVRALYSGPGEVR